MQNYCSFIKNRIAVLLISVLCILVAGCTEEQNYRLELNDLLKIESIIKLDEEMRPSDFVFTEFGFHAYLGEIIEISKYLNSGEHVIRFGKKGNGPGELQLGLAVAYNEDKGFLSIFDVYNFRIVNFSNEGEFLYFDSMTGTFIPRQKLVKNQNTILSSMSYTKHPYTMNCTLSVNNKKIATHTSTFEDLSKASYYRFALNKDDLFILRANSSLFDLKKYNISNDSLINMQFNPEEYNFGNLVSFDNVFSVGNLVYVNVDYQDSEIKYLVFDNFGAFLGYLEYTNSDEDYRWIKGSYNDHLYIMHGNSEDEIYEVENYILK